MSVVLSIYSKNAYKEYVLPHQQNIETVLSVRKEIFALSDDLEITLENVDGDWRFQKNTMFSVVRSDATDTDSPIQDGDYFQCVIRNRRVLAIMVHISEERFSAYRKYVLINDTVKIGTDTSCGIQYSFDYQGAQYITREHAVIAKLQDGFTLTDTSRNGVFVNDTRINGTVSLRFGDRIDIWGLNIVTLGQVLAIRPDTKLVIDQAQLQEGEVDTCPLQVEQAEKERYHRSPRSVGRLNTDPVNIEAPPAPQKIEEPPLLMTIGPALTMALPMLLGSSMAIIGVGTSSVYMYAGLVTAFLSAIIGATWALVNIRYNRKQAKKHEAHRFSAYSDYLIRITEEIRRKYENNSSIMKQTYPSAQQCVRDGGQGIHLWERNPNHGDFLSYRLGLGDVPFQVNIQVPAERFELVEDSLRDKPTMIRENYKTLHEVPVCIDLQKERIVGLVGGPDRSGACEILYTLIAQIAAQNCYTDVKLAFVYSQEQGDDWERWEFCRWLPHVWSEDRKVRFVASNQSEASDVFYELGNVLRNRREQQDGREIVHRPWYILVIENSSVLENEPIAKFLLTEKGNFGLTTLLLADQPEDLPNTCECMICNHNGVFEMYHTRELEQEAGLIVPDLVDRCQLEEMSRYLANVEVSEIEIGGEIPSAVTFFDMHGIAHPEEVLAEERWKKSRTYENMRALIGQKSGNQPCYLDVHEKYHGPHGLVAGTTGSGKSETLQTYILSLAMNFSPYDVGLFIIDYKGGGMANLFEGLPHMLGQISNLSGGQVHRAMVSIKSENLRRQRIFNEHGVNNINLYTTLYKNGEATIPVPHLFIIIDEFAELKREQPDFMRELISVAQVGRSLGIHLILATQKPSGTVDENIWSNSKFRLCLRVQDRQDSMDMLHKVDAAYLTQAGRGYLQVGNDEIFEQFQSGWSGAAYDEATAGGKEVLARMLTSTGKTAIVGSYIKRRTKEQLQVNWFTALLNYMDLARQSNPEHKGNGEMEERVLCDIVYDAMEKDRVDYTENEYNDRALINFLHLIQESEASGMRGESRISWILTHSTGVKLPERREKTQLDAMVEYLADVAKNQGYIPLPPLWLPPLPGQIYLDDLDDWPAGSFQNCVWPEHDKKWELFSPIGKGDDPANQMQMTVDVNFSKGGHYALIGSTASGKSTFVQTLLYGLIHRYNPDYLNIYVLDFSGRMTEPFEQAAHIGGILYENDVDRVGKLFYLMQELVNQRKKLFRGGSYSQYVMVNGVVCPAVLLVIDNIAGFREKTAEAYDEQLIRLAREGVNYGIYLFITAAGFGISEIQSRLGDHLRTTLCLELSDIYQYGDVLRIPQPAVFPESGIQGRGLINLDGAILEYQTALALIAADDYERAEKIRTRCEILNQAWPGKRARTIPFIPEKPVWADLAEHDDMPEVLKDPRKLPLGYDDATASIYSLDLSRSYCITVSGRPRTGKTNVLKLMMRAAKAKNARITVLETNGVSLKKEAQQLGAEYYSDLDGVVSFVGRMALTFKERNGIKRELVGQGLDEDAQFIRMSQNELCFVVVSDLVSFVDMVYSAAAKERNLNGALENLIGKGFLHHIYFAAALNLDTRINAVGMPVYEMFVKEQSGIHLGGNVAAQQVFDFSGMPFKEQNIPEKAGIGLTPSRDGEPYRRVILPLVKG